MRRPVGEHLLHPSALAGTRLRLRHPPADLGHPLGNPDPLHPGIDDGRFDLPDLPWLVTPAAPNGRTFLVKAGTNAPDTVVTRDAHLPYSPTVLPYVVSGLVAAGGLAAALSTADGLLLTQMAPGVTLEELTEKTGAGFAVADSLKG